MIAVIVTALVAGVVGAAVGVALRQPRLRALEAETDQHAVDAANAFQQLDATTEELELARRANVVQMLRNAGAADLVFGGAA